MVVARLTDAQIAGLAKQAGLTGSAVTIAVAVAIAESGGNPKAYNGQGGDRSYGLWQINMIGGMGPERRKWFNIKSNDELFTPSVNAKAMALISNDGKNWKPWTTYTRGTYRTYLPRANKAAKNPATDINTMGSFDKTDTTQGLQNNSSGDLSGLSEAVKTLRQKQTWIRVAWFVVGLALLIYGLMKLTGDNKLSPATKQVIGLAVQAATKKKAK